MRTLILARHAKSDWTFDLPDHNRPLNARGQRDAPRMAKWLKDTGFQPDLIVTSTATRASTTAKAFRSAFSPEPSLTFEERIYDCTPGDLHDILKNLPDSAQNVMVFGHNPAMEAMVTYLRQSRDFFSLPTCGLASFSFSGDSWKELDHGRIQLNWIQVPKLLPEGY